MDDILDDSSKELELSNEQSFDDDDAWSVDTDLGDDSVVPDAEGLGLPTADGDSPTHDTDLADVGEDTPRDARSARSGALDEPADARLYDEDVNGVDDSMTDNAEPRSTAELAAAATPADAATLPPEAPSPAEDAVSSKAQPAGPSECAPLSTPAGATTELGASRRTEGKGVEAPEVRIHSDVAPEGSFGLPGRRR